jgi:hypothetical protein
LRLFATCSPPVITPVIGLFGAHRDFTQHIAMICLSQINWGRGALILPVFFR